MTGSAAGDEQHGCSNLCPGEVMVCDGWHDVEGRLVVTEAALRVVPPFVTLCPGLGCLPPGLCWPGSLLRRPYLCNSCCF